MKTRLFWLIIILLVIPSGCLWAVNPYPRVVWSLEVKDYIFAVDFAGGTTQSCILTNKAITLFTPYGTILWTEPNPKIFRSVSLSNYGETLLLWTELLKDYRLLNKRENKDVTSPFSGHLKLSNKGEYVLNWQEDNKEIAIYDLRGKKISTLDTQGLSIMEMKLAPGDNYVLVLGIKNGKRQIGKFSLYETQAQTLPEDFIVSSLKEVTINADGTCVGAGSAIYNFPLNKLVKNIEPSVVAINASGTGYLTVDEHKQVLSYSEIGSKHSVWEARHTLDQWQEVYLDPTDQYVLTLSR